MTRRNNRLALSDSEHRLQIHQQLRTTHATRWPTKRRRQRYTYRESIHV